MTVVACVYCRNPLDPDHTSTWRRVTGWERKNTTTTSRKGGSDIACREPVNQFACDQCVRRLRRGIAPHQDTLIP